MEVSDLVNPLRMYREHISIELLCNEAEVTQLSIIVW